MIRDFCFSSASLALQMEMIRILKSISEATCKVETFGFNEGSDLRATDTRLVSKPGYLGVAYHVSGQMDFDVEIDIPGTFSVYNSLTAIAVCHHFQVPAEVIQKALKVAR